METKTDSWEIQTLRCRKSTKTAFKRLLDYLGISQDEYLKLSIDMNLRELSTGSKFNRSVKNYPYYEKMPIIMKSVKRVE